MTNIYIKGVTVRFVFDAVRTSQIPSISQKQSNGNAPRWCIICILASCWHELYIGIGVGLSALLVSTNRAMRRPLLRGTSNRTGSHAFFVSVSKRKTFKVIICYEQMY